MDESSKAFFGVLADVVVLLHITFIAFVILGGLLAFRFRWFPWVHVPAVVWGTLIELRGWLCPLTSLENWLREAGGAAAYPGGFIERYVLPIVYPTRLTREVQLKLALLVGVVNIAIYASLWVARRRCAHTV